MSKTRMTIRLDSDAMDLVKNIKMQESDWSVFTSHLPKVGDLYMVQNLKTFDGVDLVVSKIFFLDLQQDELEAVIHLSLA